METGSKRLRSARRIATAACVVAAPVLVGVARAILPVVKDAKGATTIPAYAAHLGQARAEMVLTVLATLVLPFFVLGLYRLAARGAPALAGAGCVIALIGWTVGGPIEVAGHALAYELARGGGNPAIYDQFLHNGAVNALTVIFIVGHVLGTLLLGVALWRTRAVPVWAAGAVVAGIAAHLVAAGGGIRGLDVGGFVALTAGCAAAGVAIIRSADPSTDLAPGQRYAAKPSAAPRQGARPTSG